MISEYKEEDWEEATKEYVIWNHMTAKTTIETHAPTGYPGDSKIEINGELDISGELVPQFMEDFQTLVNIYLESSELNIPIKKPLVKV